ncbi:MAG: hypothetical protein GY806_17610 [Gammaproteobacteria bacterium]|nr:hypothetical protein [Gammaproteobacteria bacterium]
MTRLIFLLLCFSIVSSPAFALSKKEVREIIKQAYPGARITEIEKETYQKKRIFEVDFKHEGENLEAIISLDGEIIKVHIDD